MNFYTLTFKSKILLTFLLVFIFIVLIDIAIFIASDRKTTEGSFIDNKFSKLKHLSMNSPVNKDIIFIGSSKTFFNISTNILKDKGINAYNLGVSATQFEDYPTLIESALKYKPKKIVISLSVHKLYNELDISNYPTNKEIQIYLDINKRKFVESLSNWAVSKHSFLTYSEPILLKLLGAYDKFTPVDNLQKSYNSDISNDSTYVVGDNADYSRIVGCDVFDIQQASKIQTYLKCKNGDGVIIGVGSKEDRKRMALEQFNNESIAYLSKMIEPVQQSGTEIIFIFEPLLNNNFRYNPKSILDHFDTVRIIDLTNFELPEKMWFDNVHMNHLGREKYSQHLASIFEAEVQEKLTNSVGY